MPVLAAMLACTVIGIADGDTLTARGGVPDGRVNVTVRVAEIDAPEKTQPLGQPQQATLGRAVLRRGSDRGAAHH